MYVQHPIGTTGACLPTGIHQIILIHDLDAWNSKVVITESCLNLSIDQAKQLMYLCKDK